MPIEHDAPYKIPRSTLVVIHTIALEVLLLERADHPGYWQSVTGSQEPGESLVDTARREVREETGLDVPRDALLDCRQENVYEIFAQWRHRYAPGTTHNTEHVFRLCLPARQAVRLNPREHLQQVWLDAPRAASLCFSWTNRDAIEALAAQGVAR